MKSLVAYRPSPIVPGPPIRAVVLDSMGTSPDEILAAGILGGAADADELASAPHTHLLLSVAGLPEVLLA